MHLHIVGGFLGSGKTTAITTASKLLQERGINVGVVTNDQGKFLVDSRFVSSLQIPFGQVTGGCFCCNYDQLDEQINQLRDTQSVQVVFAESVGSCADLMATVIKPLSVYRKGETECLSLNIFADASLLLDFLQNKPSPFSTNIIYIFSKQIEEAEILIVNKTDLLNPLALNLLKNLVSEKFPDKTTLFQNSKDSESVKKWIGLLNSFSTEKVQERKSLDIDYQQYGSGEADLAWFDQELKISSENDDAVELGKQIVGKILTEIEIRKWTIGHLKFIFEANGHTEKISFTTNVNRQDLEKLSISNASEAKLMINARIETEPDALKQLVADVVQSVRLESHAAIQELNTSAFKPGFPNPTHRMSNEE